MALVQFLEYHFDGSEAKLKIFLEAAVRTGRKHQVVDAAFAAVAGDRHNDPGSLKIAA